MAKATPKADSDAGKAPTSTRSLWKGAISFGLVHVPIALFSATSETDAEPRSNGGARKTHFSTDVATHSWYLCDKLTDHLDRGSAKWCTPYQQ